MSDTETTAAPGGLRVEFVLFAVVAILMLAALWYVMSQRQQALRSSPAGLDGLQVWLSSNGVNARNFSGGWPIDQTAVGLLVVPLYDTDLDEARTFPETKEQLLFQQDEYDLSTSVIQIKASEVPVLAVLPKWRSGMRLTGLAHPVLRAEQSRLTETLDKLVGGGNPVLNYAGTPFTGFVYETSDGRELNALIYAAQLFQSDRCEPLIGSRDMMLLARCPAAGSTELGNGNPSMLVLSDPDLLNNHGLRLGDNAEIMLDLIRASAGEKSTIIDYSRSSWLIDPTRQPERERTWSDLARFFGPPFTILWVGAGLLLAFAIWRSLVRYGPVIADMMAPGAGKTVAVEARARLLRLSGQDGELAREYVRARIASTAAKLFGPAQARHYSGRTEFLKFTERRHPAEAPRLRGILERIDALPAHLAAADAIHHIDELEQVLEQITHDA